MNIKDVDFTKVVRAKSLTGSGLEDRNSLIAMLGEARSYLQKHAWCGRIVEEFFGLGIGGIAAVFLFRIEPAKPSADPLVWVVVGDIPPLYISTDDAPNPACALDAYLGAVTKWAQVAAFGGPAEGLPPITAARTVENGKSLLSRIEFIDREILKPHAADLVSKSG